MQAIESNSCPQGAGAALPGELPRQMAERIRTSGPIPFALFMQRALYEPALGYYERPQLIGRKGDYFTSVSVGPLLGELLAFDFASRLEAALRAEPSSSGPWWMLEAGAHDGRLAADILLALDSLDAGLAGRVRYGLLDPSPARQAWQRQTLAGWLPRVDWFSSWASFAEAGARGILFSNELLDAFPVHRLGWDAAARDWFEWGVGWNGAEFTWERLGVPAALRPHLPRVPAALAEVLPDGFITEVSPAAAAWWGEAARTLRRGWLLTLDYGLEAEDRLHPDRREGTLRAYYRHQAEKDLLARPGEQDLTAQVDFTALRQAGEAAGLVTEADLTQERFLTGLAARRWKTQGAGGAWTPAQVRQFQTLTHPGHLGHAFRVLVQRREQPPGCFGYQQFTF